MAQNDNVVFKTSTTATINDLFNWNKSTGQITAKTDSIPIVPGTVYFTADGHIVHDLTQNNRLWMSKNAYSAIYAKDISETNTDIANAIKYSIHYVEGPTADTTPGTWTGTINGITELYDGLTIIYVPAVAGGSSTTTLNINGLGAKTCYYSNTSAMTTHYSVGTPILLTYRNNCWRRADYNSNTTYSAMSVAEMRTGTATSERSVRADYLKTFLSTLGGTNLTLTHSNSAPYLQLNHDPSGITAGTYGNNSQQTPSYGGTFNIPYFTVDAQGHITNASITTVKIPESDNTDYKVRQTPINSNDNNNYRILLSNSANDTSEDSVSKKNANLIYNPTENKLSTGNIKLTGELDVTGNVYLRNQTAVDSLTAGSLIVNGNSTFNNDINLAQGAVKWTSNSLPSVTSAKYFLVIDAFANGGATKYITKADAIKSLISSSAIGSSTKPVYWTGSAFNAITSYSGAAALTGTPTAPTATAGTNTTQIATTEFVTNAVAQGFIANDAMVFKGLIGSNQPITQLPTSGYNAGWTYRVANAGIFAGEYCEVGDLLIAINDGPASGSSVTNADWGKVEHNIDGAVFRGSGVSNSSVGSSTQPVYVNSSGIVTAITGAIANDTTGNAATATVATKLANTSAIGSTTLPVYFNSSGQPVAITGITKAILGNNDNNTLAYTRNGVLYAGNHYVGDSKISINSTSAGQGALYVNGSTSTNGMIIPTVDNSYNLGTRNGRWKDFYASYINVHPENRGAVLPFFINDLAFLTDRGGSYSMSKFTGTFNTSTFESVEVNNITDITNKGASNNTLFNCFNGRYNYTILSDNNQNGYYVQKTDTIIIDITCPQIYNYGSKIYIDFGNIDWCAQDIYFYTRKNNPNTNAFTLQGFIENNTEAHWFQEIYESSGINEIRIVLKNWKSDIQKISQIGLISFKSENLNNIVMSRGEDDPIYRSITPNATNTYNLGKSTYSWNNLYIKSIHFGNNSILSNLTNNIYFNINKNVIALVIENGNIRPGQNQTVNLGTSSQKWNNLYVKDFFTKEATESGTTYRTLMIGNETNRTGRISLYSGSKGGYIQQAANNTNNWILHQLPVESGWIVKAGNGTSTGAGDKETPIYVNTRGVAKPVNALPVNQNLLTNTQYYFNNNTDTKPINISIQDIPMADCHSIYGIASGVGTTNLRLGTFAPEPDTWYTLSFYAKTNYNNTSIRTHFYPDTTATSYNCQGYSSTGGDGVSIFTASTKWQRYWVCYKTSASVSGTKNLIARLISGISPGTTLRVALPKLEVGQVMTPWVPHAQDFSQNKISTCYVDNHDLNNYQWHRIATCSVGTTNYSDRDIILFVHKGYLANAFGILKISVRTDSNAASPPIKVQAKWLLRHGFSESDCFIGLTRTSIDASSAATADIYFKTSTTYARIIFTALNNFNKGFTLLNSDENSKTENDVKVTDLANSTEVYIKEDIMNGDTIESIKLKGDASSNTGTTYVSWVYASDSLSEKSLIPNANIAYNLGSSSLKWANVYANNYYGNWVGETIPVNKGGTGQTSLTVNKVLIGNGTNAIKTTSLEVDNEGNLSNTKTNQTDLFYNITNNRGSIGLRVAEKRGLFDYTQNKWIIYKPSTSTGTDNVGQTLIPSWANKGSTSIPVYFNSSGQPVAVNKYERQTGKTTNFVPLVGSDGIMEIGKYIDFHNTSEDTSDYIVRITARDSSETDGAGLTLTGTTVGTFKGNLNGTATKATQDGNGNVITSTYLPLSGGTMTGNLQWNGLTALPSTTTTDYFLAIDAFANGGTTKYITKGNALKSLISSSSIGTSLRPVYWTGSSFSQVNWFPSYCTVNGYSKNNYNYHRIATLSIGGSTWIDRDAVLVIRSRYSTSNYGIVKISGKANNNQGLLDLSAYWLIRSGFEEDSILICRKRETTDTSLGDTQVDVYLKTPLAYPRICVYMLVGPSHLDGFQLINSEEKDNSVLSYNTSDAENPNVIDINNSDLKGSYEVYIRDKDENGNLLNSFSGYNPNNSNSQTTPTAQSQVYTHIKTAFDAGSVSRAKKSSLISTNQNAIAYYTDTTGTFGQKASANGALYATSTNGSLNWGTLPVGQGGTGATSFTTNYVLVGNGTNGIKASSKLQIPVNNTGMITALLPMNLIGGTSISATDNSTGNLIIGSRTADHLALDTNEIQGRNYSNGTCTANPIYLNYRGGEVWLGLNGAIRTGIVALYPKNDLSLTLGKNAARWSNIYTKGNINIGLAGDEATIQYDSTNKTLNFIFN